MEEQQHEILERIMGIFFETKYSKMPLGEFLSVLQGIMITLAVYGAKLQNMDREQFIYMINNCTNVMKREGIYEYDRQP